MPHEAVRETITAIFNTLTPYVADCAYILTTLAALLIFVFPFLAAILFIVCKILDVTKPLTIKR